MDLRTRLRQYTETIRGDACDAGLTMPSDRVAEAMMTVPRHRFLERFYSPPQGRFSHESPLIKHTVDLTALDDAVLDVVYSDRALVTRLDDEGRPTSSSSQPSLMARMLELLDLRPGMRVLEIGTGTGYNAALLAELVGDQRLVTTIDIQPDVVNQTRRLLTDLGYGDVRVLCGDGMDGAPDYGPFDRVIATVGCPDVSWRWAEQLAPGGMLLIPLQHGGPDVAPLTRLHVTSSGNLEGQVVAWAGFMGLQGDHTAATWPVSVGDVSGRPDATSDLPPALAEAPRTMESYRAGKRAWWDFAYFLALDDLRTHLGHVLALVDPSGDRIVLTNDRISLFGITSALRDDLLDSYDRWERFKRPAAADWHIRMLPRHQPQPPHDPDRRTWLVPRPDSWQLAYVL